MVLAAVLEAPQSTAVFLGRRGRHLAPSQSRGSCGLGRERSELEGSPGALPRDSFESTIGSLLIGPFEIRAPVLIRMRARIRNTWQSETASRPAGRARRTVLSTHALIRGRAKNSMASSERRGEDDEVPEEIEETCLQVHEALAGVDRLLRPVLAVSRGNLEERVSPRGRKRERGRFILLTVGRARRCLPHSAAGLHHELPLLG